ATNVDYLKTLNMNYNISESSSSTRPSTQTIIDIIADDVESVTAQKQEEHMDSSVKYDTTATQDKKEILSKYEDKVTNLNKEANSQEENEESEDHQPKKRKR
ncbi:4986_t:CDS:2, partial [Racocetra persica]